jgi:DNA-binding NarL/FixJ family response regulator
MVTVLLIGKDLLLRHGLRIYLERAADIRIVGEASHAGEALVLAQTLHPTVVLFDLFASPTDIITTTAALHAAVPRSSIILLSLHEDALIQLQALSAGATMVIGKQGEVRGLLTAIRWAATQQSARLRMTTQEVRP